LLAFEGSIEWDIKMIKNVTDMLAGGFFNVKLSRKGMVAITTHHDLSTLAVAANKPIITYSNATVALSVSFVPESKTDISFKPLCGAAAGNRVK